MLAAAVAEEEPDAIEYCNLGCRLSVCDNINSGSILINSSVYILSVVHKGKKKVFSV